MRRGIVPLLFAAALALLYTLGPAAPRPQPGLIPAAEREPAPAPVMQDLAGRPWSLARQRGHVVLLNYWATWCIPCRREMPVLVRAAERYRGEGLRVAAIALDADAEDAVRAFVHRYAVPYPILRPDAGSALTVELTGIPLTRLIDRRGRIARTYVGEVAEWALGADIRALLAERPSGQADRRGILERVTDGGIVREDRPGNGSEPRGGEGNRPSSLDAPSAP